MPPIVFKFDENFKSEISKMLRKEAGKDHNITKSEEINKYAQSIGIDPSTEQHLMHIAHQGINAPLPEFWNPIIQDDENVYYFNSATSQCKWEHPCDEYYRENVIRERINPRKIENKPSKMKYPVKLPPLKFQPQVAHTISEERDDFDITVYQDSKKLTPEPLNETPNLSPYVCNYSNEKNTFEIENMASSVSLSESMNMIMNLPQNIESEIEKYESFVDCGDLEDGELVLTDSDTSWKSHQSLAKLKYPQFSKILPKDADKLVEEVKNYDNLNKRRDQIIEELMMKKAIPPKVTKLPAVDEFDKSVSNLSEIVEKLSTLVERRQCYERAVITQE